MPALTAFRIFQEFSFESNEAPSPDHPIECRNPRKASRPGARKLWKEAVK